MFCRASPNVFSHKLQGRVRARNRTFGIVGKDYCHYDFGNRNQSETMSVFTKEARLNMDLIN